MTKFIKIIKGSCTDMREVCNESVHFVVTSPPYLDAKDYNRDNPNNIGNYTGQQYYELMREVFRECKRVLKPGRKMCVNLQDIPAKGHSGINWSRLPFKTIELVIELGFDFCDMIIWDKGACRSAGTPMGTAPYPASPVLLNNFEYVLVFKKHGDADYSRYNDLERKKSSWYDNMGEYILPVWRIKPDTASDHPAPYPIELPMRLIKLYSFYGDIVLDPFNGSGTTGLACKLLNRRYYGFEIEDKYIKMAKDKIGWGQQNVMSGSSSFKSGTLFGFSLDEKQDTNVELTEEEKMDAEPYEYEIVERKPDIQESTTIVPNPVTGDNEVIGKNVVATDVQKIIGKSCLEVEHIENDVEDTISDVLQIQKDGQSTVDDSVKIIKSIENSVVSPVVIPVANDSKKQVKQNPKKAYEDDGRGCDW